jgi:hypothetical protein
VSPKKASTKAPWRASTKSPRLCGSKRYADGLEPEGIVAALVSQFGERMSTASALSATWPTGGQC